MGVSLTGEQIVGIGFFAWVVLGVVIAFVSNRQERDARSKRLPPLPRKTAFRASWGVRLFLALLAAFIITGYPLLYAAGIFDVRGHRPHFTAETWTLFGLLEIICVATGLPLLYVSGPSNLFLDLDRRTYRRVHGWPFRPRVQEGPWEDMAGIFVWYMPGSSLYHVGITWKRSRRDFQHLEMFANSGEADRHAEQIAAALGLPLVEPPPSRRSSTSARRP